MRVYLQVWFQNSRARQKKHQQTTTTSVVSLSSHAARNNNNNNSSTSPSRPTTPSSLMTHHPAAAVAVLSAAAGYMNLNLRNSLVLHSAAPTAFVAAAADQPTLTPDAQQHPEFVFSNSLFILSLSLSLSLCTGPGGLLTDCTPFVSNLFVTSSRKKDPESSKDTRILFVFNVTLLFCF